MSEHMHSWHDHPPAVLYPVSGLLLSPMIAAAMRMPSVSVIGNALRLQGLKL